MLEWQDKRFLLKRVTHVGVNRCRWQTLVTNG